jgi:tripartite ATP-independent transporter DctP family solute receptor
MAGLTRRRLITGIAAAGAGTAFAVNFIPSRASAAEFVLKFANQTPLDSPVNVRLREAVQKIKDESGGRVEIQIFPNSQLGSDADMISQLRTGAIDFMTETGALMENLVPGASINAVGFAFPTYAEVWKAMDGELGAYVRTQFAKANLYALEKTWDNGLRQITSGSKPIQTPADLKGFKIRVPVAPIQVALFQGLGASPVSLPLSQAYSALQTHLADGQENALILIDLFKFYEVQRYCAMTNHMWDGFWVLSSAKSWGRIPKNMQEIIERNLNAGALKQRQDGEHLNVSLQAALAKKGLVFNRPEVEPFRATLRASGYYKEWRGKFGEHPWKLLEKYAGNLT